jgi:hypothetical protein
VLDCVKATLRNSGYRGPFQGLAPTLLRNTPANAIYLGNFEVLKRQAASYYNCEVAQLPARVVVGSAGMGGITYWLAIFPVDVIKSAMQSDSVVKAERKYTSMSTTAKVSAAPHAGATTCCSSAGVAAARPDMPVRLLPCVLLGQLGFKACLLLTVRLHAVSSIIVPASCTLC